MLTQLIEKLRVLRNSKHLRHFPNGHIVMLAGLSVLLVGFTALPSEEAVATRKTIEITLPEVAEEELTPAAPEEPQVQLTHRIVKVRSGDNLSVIFKRAGLTDKHMMALLKAHPETKRLASLYPGHTLDFYLDTESKLHRLTYTIDKLNGFSFEKDIETQQFDFITHQREPDVRLAQASAFITHSLYTAGTDAHMDDKLIMELAEIFGWDIDFALDIRKGDHFKVVFEEKFLDGEKIGNGNILAAEFVNQGESFQALRYENARGEVGYYTPEGHNMRKDFLRAPVDFRRISSNFNPKRLHPILKTRRPHRGIDYAAATGTPVWSSGNGRVIKAGYSKSNGNYVVIQHGNNIQTKYLHLHKRYVKKGQRVKQKQKIGTVGSTGLATGPHLHYEFLINGVHRNPRTIVRRLPKARSVSANELARFVGATKDQVAMLNDAFETTRFADANSGDTKSL